MSLYVAYDKAIATGFIQDNPAQRAVLPVFQACFDALNKPRFLTWFAKSPQGIYLYGPVGSGKTFLMDIFFDALTVPKERMHLHAFIQSIDMTLRAIQGTRDPMTFIANDLAKKIRVLCLDECMVTDRLHAMLLGTLLPFLLARGIVLVTTSNEPPQNLYKNGFHREQFLPAITAIETHCHVISLDAGVDYRETKAPSHQNYFWPLSDDTTHAIRTQFKNLPGVPSGLNTLFIQKRPVMCLAEVTDAVWFDFHAICTLPRSALDYLEIADRFKTVFISDIPALSDKDAVSVLLFIRLVDILYDARVRLVLSAAVPLDALYTGIDMRETFHRILSRLTEMQ